MRRLSSRTRSNSAASASEMLRSSSSASPKAVRASSSKAGERRIVGPVLAVGVQRRDQRVEASTAAAAAASDSSE